MPSSASALKPNLPPTKGDQQDTSTLADVPIAKSDSDRENLGKSGATCGDSLGSDGRQPRPQGIPLGTQFNECSVVARCGRCRSRRSQRGVGRGSPPDPNPKPDVQVSLHPAFQTFLEYGNVAAVDHMPPKSIAAERIPVSAPFNRHQQLVNPQQVTVRDPLL